MSRYIRHINDYEALRTVDVTYVIVKKFIVALEDDSKLYALMLVFLMYTNLVLLVDYNNPYITKAHALYCF